MDAGAEPRVAAVLCDEDADVEARRGARDERRLHVHDRRVADERAAVDHAVRTHLQRGDRHVVRRAVVVAAGQIAFAGLRGCGGDEPAEYRSCQDDAHRPATLTRSLGLRQEKIARFPRLGADGSAQRLRRLAEARHAGEEEPATLARRLLEPSCRRTRRLRCIRALHLDEPVALEAGRVEDDDGVGAAGAARPGRAPDLRERAHPLGLADLERDGEPRELLVLVHRVERGS